MWIFCHRVLLLDKVYCCHISTFGKYNFNHDRSALCDKCAPIYTGVFNQPFFWSYRYFRLDHVTLKRQDDWSWFFICQIPFPVAEPCVSLKWQELASTEANMQQVPVHLCQKKISRCILIYWRRLSDTITPVYDKCAI